MSVKIPKKLLPILETNFPYHEVFIYGGRSGFKSGSIYLITQLLQNNDTEPNDVLYGRASYDSLGDSVVAEVREAQDKIGVADLYIAKSQPYKFVRKDNNCLDYFIGLGGSIDRTKGFKSVHKLSYVVFEEIQELKTRDEYENALSTVLRRMRDKGKHIVFNVFNPPNWKLHWVNKLLEEKLRDKSCLCIKMAWDDCPELLSNEMIKSILRLKITNPTYYDFMYMGNPTGADGLIYPMFLLDKHKITYQQWLERTFITKIQCVVIGCDFAVNNDETCLCPLAILDTGQAVALTPFIHNPKLSGVIGTAKLCETYITSWWNELDNKFLISKLGKPVFASCDIAGSDAIVNMRTYLGAKMTVFGCSKGTITQMIGEVQSVISKNMLYFLEERIYRDYVLNKSVRYEHHPVAEQLTILAWNENQDGYKKDIPNDRTDALTYGIYAWYKNPNHLAQMEIFRRYFRQYYTIDDILKN